MKERFYQLRELLEAAFKEEDLAKAKTLAEKYLALAAEKEEDWNYGNAIHHGHIFLGRIALRKGNIEKAKEHLLEAGKTPGSPQLNSFGPNMTLAEELLERGEREVVLEYLDACKTFWLEPMRAIRAFPVWKWQEEIRRGEVPEFGAHLLY